MNARKQVNNKRVNKRTLIREHIQSFAFVMSASIFAISIIKAGTFAFFNCFLFLPFLTFPAFL
jgi:hypothetical protein